MANPDPKMRSITGNLTPNALTERTDDFTFNVTYQARRSVQDICKLAAENGSKFSASELESAYNDLLKQAETELFNASTVEFGFSYNQLGVSGSFIGPKAQFDPAKNSVDLRCTPSSAYKEVLKNISVIVSGTNEGLPTITRVFDKISGTENDMITPGGGLNGEGVRVCIAGDEEHEVGFYFIETEQQQEYAVPAYDLLVNTPTTFSLIVPQLPAGKSFYLEIVTQWSGNTKKLLKEPRRNRFPYILKTKSSSI